MSSKNNSNLVALLVGQCPIRLWGVDCHDRLRRQLRAQGVTQILNNPADAPAGCEILILRVDYIYDDRTLRELVTARPLLLTASAAGTVVAARVGAELGERAAAVVSGELLASAIPDLARETPASLSPSLLDAQKKAVAPLVLPVRREHQKTIERYLFDGAYKGTTDLVTKWVWPPLARRATHLCTRYGIVPNAVTSVSLTLAIVVIALFSHGWLGLGLCLAWTMTFLDTVDGKLARVTVTSTRFGHYFDHLIDLIHPPLWYIAWGYGISTAEEFAGMHDMLVLLLAGYIVGRLLEGTFKKLLAGFTMFVWRPFDSYFRLIIARRNPSLLLLTGGMLLGNAHAGLVAVVGWTLLSSAILATRVLQALMTRVQGGSLRSWLADLHLDHPDLPAWSRPFAPDQLAVLRLQDQGEA